MTHVSIIGTVGKVVVDITNPLNFQTFDSLTVPADSSAAAQLAAALPHSRVVKAFNTNLAATLASGTVGEVPVTVLIADDGSQAKAVVADVVTAGGLRAIDAGTLAPGPRTRGACLLADQPGRTGQGALDRRLRHVLLR